MFRVTEDATFFNTVCNTDGVLERVSWTGERVDVQPLLDSGSGFILDDEVNGGFLLHSNSPNSYIIHTAFLPSTPVNYPLQLARECLWGCFMALDAQKLYSSACKSNPAAARLMRRCGFQKDFESDSRFGNDLKEGFYSLDIDSYIRESKKLKTLGEQFHTLVEDTTNHGEDEVHDQYAGAAVALIQCANYRKAEEVYNRWAFLTGYEPLNVLEDERIVEVGDMSIHLTDELKIKGVVCQ